MKTWIMAAASMARPGACNQLPGMGGGEPPLPPVQAGAQAPTQLPAAPSVQQANVTPQVRQGLEQQMTQLLDNYAGQFAQGQNRVQGLNDEVKAMQPGTDHRWRISLLAN